MKNPIKKLECCTKCGWYSAGWSLNPYLQDHYELHSPYYVKNCPICLTTQGHSLHVTSLCKYLDYNIHFESLDDLKTVTDLNFVLVF